MVKVNTYLSWLQAMVCPGGYAMAFLFCGMGSFPTTRALGYVTSGRAPNPFFTLI